jgi:hypothetical protein
MLLVFICNFQFSHLIQHHINFSVVSLLLLPHHCALNCFVLRQILQPARGPTLGFIFICFTVKPFVPQEIDSAGWD